jgi:hypothetical protein
MPTPPAPDKSNAGGSASGGVGLVTDAPQIGSAR